MFKRLTLPVLASALVLATAAFSLASAGHRPIVHRPHSPVLHQPHHPHHPVHWRFASHGWHWRHGSHGRTVYLDGGYVEGGEAYPATGAAATCPASCLGKEYLENGSVRFFDRCTKESAIAVPALAPRG
jgi:hypothetical protein